MKKLKPANLTFLKRHTFRGPFFTKNILNGTLNLSQPKQIKIVLPEHLVKKIERLKKIYGENLNEVEIIEALVEEKLKAPKESTKEDDKAAELLVRQETLQKSSRYIPIAIKREVWKRAKGKCEKCGSYHNLEYEHLRPYGLGGANTLENIIIKCHNCNIRSAIKTYGMEKMGHYLEKHHRPK